MGKGKIIVIEGASDAVGKTTQCKMLLERLRKAGFSIRMHHFPSSDSTGAYLVDEYLSGNLGKRDSMSPYAISSFYAMDRFYTFQKDLAKAYKEGQILLLDRYTTSNMIYQASHFKSKEEKVVFAKWVEDYEYHKLTLPKPDLVIYLTATEELIIEHRKERKRDGRDINEEDESFLHHVYQTGRLIADTFHFVQISCDRDGCYKKEVEINDEIYREVKEMIK